ncbi:MAG: response regulator [Chthoniobacter sp.]|nr:response regulator [Chthoniobacter sp.]
MKTVSATPLGADSVLPLPTHETILVVDDQPALCEVAVILLEHCGYRVLTAHDATEAKAIVRQNSDIDLLLTDIEMPGMLGDELAEWFRAQRPQGAVIFMSGNPMQRRRLEEYPFIEKPFVHLDILVNTIRETLRRQHTTRQGASIAA